MEAAPPVTSPSVVFIIVCGLLAFSLIGLLSIVYLIIVHAEGVMIAIVSGPTVTALGGLMSMLNNTRTFTNGKTNGNTPSHP